MIETDKEPDLTMKVDEESGKKPFSHIIARNKAANGFKTNSRSVSSGNNENSRELMFEKPAQNACEDLPPQIATLKLSRKRLDKVMNEHRRNDGFRRVY